jgi:hypothetical protein
MTGYGFSGEPAELGWDAGRIARAWAELMRRLGCTPYVAQGGDAGAVPPTQPAPAMTSRVASGMNAAARGGITASSARRESRP